MKNTSRDQLPGQQSASCSVDTDPPIGPVGIARLWPGDAACDLEDCAPFDRICFRTRRSDYEVIVLNGGSGSVLVRGGRYFPEFDRARLAGSTLGGSAIKVRTIQVGCRLELRIGRETIVTSSIEAVSRRSQLAGSSTARVVAGPS